MNITEITVTVARLIALPNYENVRFEATVKATVAPTDLPDAVYEECLDFCKQKIKAELDRFYPPKQPAKPTTVVTKVIRGDDDKPKRL